MLVREKELCRQRGWIGIILTLAQALKFDEGVQCLLCDCRSPILLWWRNVMMALVLGFWWWHTTMTRSRDKIPVYPLKRVTDFTLAKTGV